MNIAMFRSLIWQLKFVSVIIGCITLSLIVSDSFYTFSHEGKFYTAIVIITFMVSTIWIIFAFIDALSENPNLTKLDFFYHACGGFLLIIGGICWFVVVGRYKKHHNNSYFIQNIFGGLFGIINGLLYIFIGFWLFRSASSTE